MQMEVLQDLALRLWHEYEWALSIAGLFSLCMLTVGLCILYYSVSVSVCLSVLHIVCFLLPFGE